MALKPVRLDTQNGAAAAVGRMELLLRQLARGAVLCTEALVVALAVDGLFVVAHTETGRLEVLTSMPVEVAVL